MFFCTIQHGDVLQKHVVSDFVSRLPSTMGRKASINSMKDIQTKKKLKSSCDAVEFTMEELNLTGNFQSEITLPRWLHALFSYILEVCCESQKQLSKQEGKKQWWIVENPKQNPLEELDLGYWNCTPQILLYRGTSKGSLQVSTISTGQRWGICFCL